MISSGGLDESHTMTPMLKKINTKAKDTSNLLHNLTVTSHIATHYGVLDHHHMSFEFKVKKIMQLTARFCCQPVQRIVALSLRSNLAAQGKGGGGI